MPIPDYQSLMRPVLESAREGEVRIGDAVEKLADQLGLTEHERAELLPSGKQTVFANRVHWAKTYLKQAGLVESTRRAHYRITERGRAALANGQRIDTAYLMQFPEFIEFRARSSDAAEEPVSTPTPIIAPSTTRTPDEIIRGAHQQIETELRSELLERILAAPPSFFERLVVKLLVEMGYGGSVANAGRALGRSGDNGVDGVIDQDALGLDRVYIQAKRYGPGNSVGASPVRDFFGSLDRFRASKGLFVTMSTFTAEARETVGHLSKRIVLIDGMTLLGS
jgi:restriction system protein